MLLKQIITIILLTCISFLSWTQANPGNVGIANITGWFKPDNLVLGNLTSWTTTLPLAAPITLTDTYGTGFPVATNTPLNATSNYNTTIDFGGNNAITLKVLGTSSTLNLLNNNALNNQGTMFTVYHFKPTEAPNGGHIVNYRESSTASAGDGIQFRGLGATVGTGTTRLAIGSINSVNGSHDHPLLTRPTITSYYGNKSSATTFKTFENNLEYTTNPVSSSSTGSVGLFIGGRYAAPTMDGLMTGYISEVIFYNTNLTALERLKVESYLGIKYGITLQNSGLGTQGDYLATDGTIIWNADDSVSYHHDVIGIGRDDAEGLMQKQSHSYDDSCRIYLSTLAPANINNIGVFSNNISYLMMGHDTLRSCGTQNSNMESPSTVYSRFEREFKVTKTNFPDIFSWDVKIDTCQSIEFMDPANVRLLVDADGDFTDANVYDQTSGLTFSILNGTLTIAGITSAHVPNDSTVFMTFGYNDIIVSLSGPSICAGEDAVLTFNVSGTSTPVNITYTINGVTNVATNITGGETIVIPAPTTPIIYSFSPYINLLNCCGSGSSDQTINIFPLPTVTAHASITSLCAGESTLLYGTGATSYTWSNLVIDSVYFVPGSTSNYTVTGIDINGCSDQDNISITVNPVPNVSINATDNALCIGESVILTGNGATTYQWNNGLINGQVFTPNSTNTYQLIGFGPGNCSDTTTIQITVNPLPTVVANASDISLCEGDQVILTGTGAQTYLWNNGVIDNTVFVPTTSTTYQVTGTDVNGCIDTDQITVNVHPIPLFDLGPDTGICPGDSISIGISNNGDNYQWNLGGNNSMISVNSDGTYSLTVTTAFGCQSSDSKTINVFITCEELVIPNVFTPNNDNINDFFQIQGTDNLESLSIVIVNRWGNVVFESSDLLLGWNGKDNNVGLECQDGVYFYTIRYKMINLSNESEAQGFITLER